LILDLEAKELVHQVGVDWPMDYHLVDQPWRRAAGKQFSDYWLKGPRGH
jgi:hypothetical protein